jgi:Winged helix DNA-binding domain
MNLRDVVDGRLAAQRISATAFTRPAEVVAWLGAVQAQDYLGALWAVGLRLTDGREQDIERALADRSIVRTWPMRGTLHFVAGADARWMVELLGPRIVAGTARRFRALDLDASTFTRARRVLARRLEGGKALTRAAIYDALARAKIPVAGARGLGILWRLAHDCFVCFGPRQGKQQSFVLFDEWLPRARGLPREEALAELARRYFTGHGPATLLDFAWWSGLTRTEARHAVHLARERLEEHTIRAATYWCAPPPTPTPAPSTGPRAYLLPAFDELLVGYADRSASIARPHMARVNVGWGLLSPTIVVDGRIVGTWKRRFVRGDVVFSPTLFTALGARRTAALARALRRYGEFLGANARAEA